MNQPSLHRRHGLLYASDPRNGTAWIFDGKGLLRSALVEGEKIKRGWNGRVQKIQLRSGTDQSVVTLSPEEGLTVLKPVHRRAESVFNRADRNRVPPWGKAKYLRTAREFTNLYGDVPILPPDQYRSLLVNVTEGCSYNRCHFCDFYEDREYRVRSPDSSERHVNRVIQFFGPNLQYFHGLFLGEGDALSAPVNTLAKILRQVRENARLPTHTISCFGQGNTARFRTETDFERLKNAGLHRVYLGLETGSNRLLEKLNKPLSPVGFRRTVRLLKQAGILVGCIVLVGVGGETYRAEHERQTLNLIRSLPLDERDRLFVSPLTEGSIGWSVDPGTKPNPLTSEERKHQEQFFRRGSPSDVPVIHYDIDSFLY